MSPAAPWAVPRRGSPSPREHGLAEREYTPLHLDLGDISRVNVLVARPIGGRGGAIFCGPDSAMKGAAYGEDSDIWDANEAGMIDENEWNEDGDTPCWRVAG